MEMSFQGDTCGIKASGKVVATATANTKFYELKDSERVLSVKTNYKPA
jgi:hypothetical protein